MATTTPRSNAWLGSYHDTVRGGGSCQKSTPRRQLFTPSGSPSSTIKVGSLQITDISRFDNDDPSRQFLEEFGQSLKGTPLSHLKCYSQLGTPHPSKDSHEAVLAVYGVNSICDSDGGCHRGRALCLIPTPDLVINMRMLSEEKESSSRAMKTPMMSPIMLVRAKADLFDSSRSPGTRRKRARLCASTGKIPVSPLNEFTTNQGRARQSV